MPHREHEGGDGDGGGWGLIGAPAETQDDDAVYIIAQERKSNSRDASAGTSIQMFAA